MRDPCVCRYPGYPHPSHDFVQQMIIRSQRQRRVLVAFYVCAAAGAVVGLLGLFGVGEAGQRPSDQLQSPPAPLLKSVPWCCASCEKSSAAVKTRSTEKRPRVRLGSRAGFRVKEASTRQPASAKTEIGVQFVQPLTVLSDGEPAIAKGADAVESRYVAHSQAPRPTYPYGGPRPWRRWCGGSHLPPNAFNRRRRPAAVSAREPSVDASRAGRQTLAGGISHGRQAVDQVVRSARRSTPG